MPTKPVMVEGAFDKIPHGSVTPAVAAEAHPIQPVPVPMNVPAPAETIELACICIGTLYPPDVPPNRKAPAGSVVPLATGTIAKSRIAKVNECDFNVTILVNVDTDGIPRWEYAWQTSARTCVDDISVDLPTSQKSTRCSGTENPTPWRY